MQQTPTAINQLNSYVCPDEVFDTHSCEAIRCLKRYLAREVYYLLHTPGALTETA